MATVTRSQKIRLGIFLAAGLAVLVAGFVALVGRTLMQERDDYVVRFSSRNVSFSGLEVGSPVKYSGIAIGQVKDLRIAPDDVSVIEVVIAVKRGTPIAEDSEASLANLGITGLKYVELSRGSPSARVRSPGETLPAGDSLMDSLSARAGSIAERLDDILGNLQGMVGADTNRNVQRILGESAGILEDNRPQIAGILGNVRALTADLSKVSESGVSVAAKTDELMTKLNAVGDALEEALSPEGRLAKTLDHTDQVLERMNMVILRSENDLDVTLRHLRDAAANLHDFSVAVRDDPRVLLTNPEGGEGEVP